MPHPIDLSALLIGAFEGLPIRKRPRVDILRYEKWVRENNVCAVCGTSREMTVSHCKKKGRCGNHASSIFCIAKCMNCHVIYERMSYEDFSVLLWKQWKTTIPALIVATWQRWVSEHNVSFYFKLGLDHLELTVQEFGDMFVEEVENTIIDFYKK